MKKSLSIIMALLMVVSIASLFTFGASAEVKTVYVDGNADDGGDGSKSKPYNVLADAFTALPEGGEIIAIGDIDGCTPTRYKTKKNEDGTIETLDELDDYYIILPKHEGTINIKGQGGRILLTPEKTACFINYGTNVYSDIEFVLGSQRIMFCVFGETSRCTVDKTCTMTGNTSGHYIYSTGNLELYAGSFQHAFVGYNNVDPELNGKESSVLVIGGTATIATVWGCGLGDFSANSTIIVQKEGTVSAGVWGGGQSSNITGTFTLINKGGSVSGNVNANSNNGAAPANSIVVGVEGGQNFKSTALQAFTAVKDNEAKFDGFVNEYKVEAATHTPVVIPDILTTDTKLFAIVDGKPVESPYLATSADGSIFNTVEGATNYVFASAPKAEEKPDEKDKPAETGDMSLAVIALVAIIAAAGAVACKKAR